MKRVLSVIVASAIVLGPGARPAAARLVDGAVTSRAVADQMNDARDAQTVAPMHTNVSRTATQQPRSQQPRISVTYQGSDIRDVIAAFAAFSGRTIIPSSNVGAIRVDAEIKDQPWDVALAAILSAHGLAATEDANGIIIVDTQERIAARATTEPLTTRVVRLNYQRATPVAEQIRQRLLQCIPSERAPSSSQAAGQPPVAGAPPAQPVAPTSPAGGETVRGRGNVSAAEAPHNISITPPCGPITDS